MKSVIKWAIGLALLASACAKSKPNASDQLHAGDLLVDVAIDPDPPRAGDNVLHVTVNDANGKPVDGARVGFVYDMPAMGAMPEMKGSGDTKALGRGKYDVAYALSSTMVKSVRPAAKLDSALCTAWRAIGISWWCKSTWRISANTCACISATSAAIRLRCARSASCAATSRA